MHLRQKALLKPDLSPKFLSTLDPNPTRKARPDLQLRKRHNHIRCYSNFAETRFVLSFPFHLANGSFQPNVQDTCARNFLQTDSLNITNGLHETASWTIGHNQFFRIFGKSAIS